MDLIAYSQFTEPVLDISLKFSLVNAHLRMLCQFSFLHLALFENTLKYHVLLGQFTPSPVLVVFESTLVYKIFTEILSPSFCFVALERPDIVLSLSIDKHALAIELIFHYQTLVIRSIRYGQSAHSIHFTILHERINTYIGP